MDRSAARAGNTPYPLHLGITEAGLLRDGTIKSSIGLGISAVRRNRRH